MMVFTHGKGSVELHPRDLAVCPICGAGIGVECVGRPTHLADGAAHLERTYWYKIVCERIVFRLYNREYN